MPIIWLTALSKLQDLRMCHKRKFVRSFIKDKGILHTVKFSLLLILGLTPSTLLAFEYKAHIEKYSYGKVFGVDLPFLDDYEAQKVLPMVSSGFRLAVLNSDIRVSVKNSDNLCDLKGLDLLTKYSESCLAVELYSVNSKLMSASEKTQLEIYKDSFEFSHLTGLELKTVTLYQGGVLFEYLASEGVFSYYFIKELGSSQLLEYSIFDAPAHLFTEKVKNSQPREVNELVSHINSFLKGELSIEEFKELDLEGITVIDI